MGSSGQRRDPRCQPPLLRRPLGPRRLGRTRRQRGCARRLALRRAQPGPTREQASRHPTRPRRRPHSYSSRLTIPQRCETDGAPHRRPAVAREPSSVAPVTSDGRPRPGWPRVRDRPEPPSVKASSSAWRCRHRSTSPTDHWSRKPTWPWRARSRQSRPQPGRAMPSSARRLEPPAQGRPWWAARGRGAWLQSFDGRRPGPPRRLHAAPGSGAVGLLPPLELLPDEQRDRLPPLTDLGPVRDRCASGRCMPRCWWPPATSLRPCGSAGGSGTTPRCHRSWRRPVDARAA